LLRRVGGYGAGVGADQQFVVHSLSLLNLLTAQKSSPNLLFTAQAGVYCWSDCPQLRVNAGVLLLTGQLTKVDFIYHVMEHFTKSLVFLQGESSALTFLLKAEGEPLPRKITYTFFSQRSTARAIRSKAEEELQ